MQDIASALGKSLDRDGTGGMRSPLDMGGFPIIHAAPGSDPTDLATVEQAASNGVPIGSVVDFAGTTAPTGYLLCYGTDRKSVLSGTSVSVRVDLGGRSVITTKNNDDTKKKNS